MHERPSGTVSGDDRRGEEKGFGGGRGTRHVGHMLRVSVVLEIRMSLGS